MKKTICSILFTFACSVAQAKDMQLFNPDVFGQPTSKEIKLLQDKISDEIEPITVMIDMKCGKYYAATITYPNKVTFKEARESLNRAYKTYENQSLFEESKSAVWRVVDKGFSISLYRGVCNPLTKEGENQIQVVYIQFQPTREVLKNMIKSMGANTDALESDECSEVNSGLPKD